MLCFGSADQHVLHGVLCLSRRQVRVSEVPDLARSYSFSSDVLLRSNGYFVLELFATRDRRCVCLPLVAERLGPLGCRQSEFHLSLSAPTCKHPEGCATRKECFFLGSIKHAGQTQGCSENFLEVRRLVVGGSRVHHADILRQLVRKV